MVSIQERFVIKSGLCWYAYGTSSSEEGHKDTKSFFSIKKTHIQQGLRICCLQECGPHRYAFLIVSKKLDVCSFITYFFLDSKLCNLIHTIQNEDLDQFLFLQTFDNFLWVYLLQKVDMHHKKLNSARIFQEINMFAHFCFIFIFL